MPSSGCEDDALWHVVGIELCLHPLADDRRARIVGHHTHHPEPFVEVDQAQDDRFLASAGNGRNPIERSFAHPLSPPQFDAATEWAARPWVEDHPVALDAALKSQLPGGHVLPEGGSWV